VTFTAFLKAGLVGIGSVNAANLVNNWPALSKLPVLSITKTHTGNFSQGQQNATYSVTVSNAANAGASSGTVTVTDTLPSGLALVSMAGSGWACSANHCSRSDVLNGGASFPSITVTVNVASSASSPQVNQVSVSGGGSGNANAIDSTTITVVVPAATASFVASDTTTQGNWHGVYGANGYSIANDSQSTPSYASFAVQNQLNYTWAASTTDPRALQTGSGSGRIATTWYGNSPFSFDVNLTDGNTHQFAVYAVDWDARGRTETVQVFDANTNALLDTRALSSFSNGVYLVWSLSGHVKINVTLNSGVNAVVSGVFFGGASTGGTKATASFVASDTTTQGNWHGVYGANGYSIANDSQSIPSYASFAVQNQLNYTWAATSTDPRALQTGSGSGRIASTWYGNSPFSFDINLTDGNTHQFALYAVDWDARGRTETVQVVDANTNALLDTRTLSTFANGVYLVWNLSGHVRINVILGSGVNAVVSGVFFGGASTGGTKATASFVAADTKTQGTWHGVYGLDGYSVANDSQSIPSYASFAVQNQLNYTWAASTTDPRALQTGSGSGRIAATWYGNSPFSFDINLTDGNTHQFALYAVDWDVNGRTETIQVVDANTNAVLDTRALSSFSNGVYLVWNFSGHVRINVVWTGGVNAVVSGVFFR
jgi:uncharacterized repeat protein (TIGR01451 family)